MGKFLIVVLLLSALAAARAGLENEFGDMIKGGIKKATGLDTCDARHFGAGVIACPMPGMSQDRAFCCYRFITKEPDCCSWAQNNMQTIVIVLGVIVVLALMSCCACCYCCCCRRNASPGGVIVMQQPPTAYPNHPHLRLNEPV